MSILNTRDTYGRVAQCLHWLTAALILTLLALGLWMEDLPRETAAEVDRVVFYYGLHKVIGIATLAVVLVRIGWAIANPHPGLLNAGRRLEAFAASAIHWVLYGAILLMPVSGWLYHASHAGSAPILWPPGLDLGQGLPLVPKSHELSRFFGELHAALAWVIIAAIVLHVGGALKHAVIDRDETLRRMLPFARPPQAEPPAAQPRRLPPLAAAGLLFVVILAFAGWSASSTAPQDAGGAQLAAADGTAADGNAADGAPAGNWIVDPQASSLSILVQLMGSSVGGAFGSWEADIRFDPDDLPGSRVVVTIDTASLTLGDVSEQATGPAYLDSAGHPTARFEATTFRRLAEGRYEAVGDLTLRGVTAPVTLPFDLAIDGDTARMNGRTRLDRLTFAVGAEAMPDDDTLGFPVDIVVEVTATRRP
ncbi:cytochrome b/b6 domain-containing protein [Marinibaculum pumilum]|uniref:Cytochrome b/b6 domain-containing protein n=1 Tax=Marinibaculum pumilum TaxID=1766165 RepID=A0ABV7L5J2_9PROT